MFGAPFGACSGFRAGRIMKQSERLMSLDALRGFDMLFIMGFASLVVAVCGLWPSAVTDAAAASMSHVAWDGFAHHDTIFPLFLFIAGVQSQMGPGKSWQLCSVVGMETPRHGIH